MSGKGGIFAELARRVELNRQRAIDSPILRARWRKFSSNGGGFTPGTPKQKQKSLLPGILEQGLEKRNLSRASSDCGFHSYFSEEQDCLEEILRAIKNSKHKKLKSILKDKKINLNTLNFHGVGPLHEACYYGNLKCVKALVECGADVNFSDSEGWTPLFAAVCGGNIQCVEYLVDNRSIINCYNFYGISPLRVAVLAKNLSIIDYLVKRGADIMAVADDGKSTFQIAVELNDDSILTYFLHLPSMHVA